MTRLKVIPNEDCRKYIRAEEIKITDLSKITIEGVNDSTYALVYIVGIDKIVMVEKDTNVCSHILENTLSASLELLLKNGWEIYLDTDEEL